MRRVVFRKTMFIFRGSMGADVGNKGTEMFFLFPKTCIFTRLIKRCEFNTLKNQIA